MLLQQTATIVAAYISRNDLPVAGITQLISTVYTALRDAETPPEPVAKTQQPAIAIKKSIGDDHIICLEDGKKFKSMKRHLETKYGMTPDQYRKKWGLPSDYPMVAPSYARSRSELARKTGLGAKKGRTA